MYNQLYHTYMTISCKAFKAHMNASVHSLGRMGAVSHLPKAMKELVVPHSVKACSPRRASQYSLLYPSACLLMSDSLFLLPIPMSNDTVIIDSLGR